jgi:hypothetical protein
MDNGGNLVPDHYYGDGFTSSKIKEIIKEYLFDL